VVHLIKGYHPIPLTLSLSKGADGSTGVTISGADGDAESKMNNEALDAPQ
jgi:hypothetical protein